MFYNKNIKYCVWKVISIFQEKKINLFIYGIHSILLYVDRFVPRVKKWNGFAIRSNVEYKETRLKGAHPPERQKKRKIQ